MTETPDFVARPWPPRNPPIDLPEPPDGPVLLTVHLALRHAKPKVWRRVTIPGELDLGRVHDVIQQAMGWTDSHLHRFSLGEYPYEPPYFINELDIEEDGEEGTLETDARLDQVLREPGDTITYEYDFGDGWTHTLTLESVDPLPTTAELSGGAEAGPAPYPLVCLAGERACPPEDVGGIPGYEEMAIWVRSGYDPDLIPDPALTVEHLRGWLPDGWHPDHFHLDEVNAALARLAPRDLETALAQLPSEVAEIITRLSTPARFELDDWLAAPGWGDPVEFTAEEAAALTKPVRIVLDAVGDGLNLTAADYLPPRVVATIYDALELGDGWWGKGRESDTWPVLHLRENVRRLGLLRKVKGRLLPTAAARKVRDDPAALLAHVVSRMASGLHEFARLATLLTLVAIAGGQWRRHLWRHDAVLEVVCLVLSIRGYRRADRNPIETDDVSYATRETIDLLEQLLRGVGDPSREPEVAARLARAVLAATP